MPELSRSLSRLRVRYAGWQNKRRIMHIARQVADHASPTEPRAGGGIEASGDRRPVIVFNASTRLTNLSLNASFSLLTSWGLRLAGAPVIQFVCEQGMSRCVLGVNRQDYSQPPPCKACIAQSRRLYEGADVRPFVYQQNSDLEAALRGLDIQRLSQFEYQSGIPGLGAPIPLGALALPSMRWTLRRHHLPDDEPTCFLMRQFLLSAYHVASQFARLVAETSPASAVIFNGIMYPEATARWVGSHLGLRVVTHEVGFQKFSTFFTNGQATAYPIHIPQEFQLNPAQEARLDAYLEARFQGKFSMAGIQFWPEMRGLDGAFLKKASGFRQIVPVFTNVVYDTSQVHANVIFPHMFAWLDTVLQVIRQHSDTLFVIRAHPDEMRPGSAKQSNESVRDWVGRTRVDELDNVVFIDSQEYISSYELIQRAKFLIVYNSSIGLEASLMGLPVICGGKARYTQYPTVFAPQSADEFRSRLVQFLASEKIQVPPEFQRNARRFLYYQLYRASLPLNEYLQDGPRPGFVMLRPFTWKNLLPEHSPAIRVLVEGILHNQPFLMPKE
jgi:hypothetical protein